MATEVIRSLVVFVLFFIVLYLAYGPQGPSPRFHGVNDVSVMLRAAWIDPFATDMDPRHLLIVAADELDSMDPGGAVAPRLRRAWNDPFGDRPDIIVCEEDTSAKREDVRSMLRVAADEIDRLESERRG